ncbi:WD40 repeat-like protein [Cylindrobasidium torrendii FP15055 ss-10]|uniref:WD40 repeat-like protein n=1 Tax=Cylindrobasidium torrendii FP15055 ss-10 TaxID=1314674 RepID=A0A0D7B9K2_9AGAR|nr:WD40 repeat-like protein [Cylindrobasidium torrendii FP15055 ss-10]
MSLASSTSLVHVSKEVAHVTADEVGTHKEVKPIRAFTSKGEKVTSILPFSFGSIVRGYGDGYLRAASLPDLVHSTVTSKCSDIPLNGGVIGLHVVQNERTKEYVIVGGGMDGSIAFWDSETLTLVARWVMFITPLARVLQFDDLKVGTLRGCALCISQDGTIAIVAVDGFQFLCLVPGSAFPLVRVCVGEDNLLLVYANGKARLWDIKTREFRRSMSVDKANEVAKQSGWMEVHVNNEQCLPRGVLRRWGGQSVLGASKMLFDLQTFITDAVHVMKGISTSRDETRVILGMRARIQTLLAILLTPGLDAGIDDVCREDLGVSYSPKMSVGFMSEDFVTAYQAESPVDFWSISEDFSALRLVAIVVALRALGLFEELSDYANTVVSFYVTTVAGAVWERFCAPSLAYLGRMWFEGSSETRTAVRTVFDARVIRLEDEIAMAVTEQWQHRLPCLQPTADRESPAAALALFICGSLAAEKYSLFSTNTLTDVSKSIQMYLHDTSPVAQILAVDLCSRGFHVWQHYIDSMEILRSLFSLATSTKKDAITAHNVGAQARLAVLHIATENTPLFMTTLGLDILNPASLEQRRSVMQIVAFLIRKRPLVLYPNLTKLMEAVVRSLDPNATANRDAVLDAATEIIGHVVKTFPSADFHGGTQRLAVGTGEGAVIMYDLKTAIRLYVLERHSKRLDACSFSPDGRRLVTLSLDESEVVVWKVGSSFSNFFYPGAPPRQGHGGNEPYKTLSFSVGDQGNMSIPDTFKYLRFEWVADRSVKLRIRESILTFST